jgi:hypothetical protein
MKRVLGILFYIVFMIGVLYGCYYLFFGGSSIERQTADNKRIIIISLTTSPARIHSIQKTLECLLKQTLVPDKIVLNLPHVYKRSQTKFTEIPRFITDNPKIHINFTEDIGPATKILPTVDLEKNNPDALILSVDDDHYYPPEFLRVFVDVFESIGKDVVITNSFQMPAGDKICANTDNTRCFWRVHMLEGFAGVLYNQKYLVDIDKSILMDPKTANACYRGDDYYLSNHINKKKIPIVALDGIARNSMKKGFKIDNSDTSVQMQELPWLSIAQMASGFKNDALHRQPGGHPYKECEAYLARNNNLFMPPLEDLSLIHI